MGDSGEGSIVRARTSMKLLCEGPVNVYLLCSVVSKQTRRLGRLLPEERVAELITIALRNCADHKLDIRMDGNVPQVIREEAARMFPSSGSRNPTLDSSDGQSDGSQERDASSSFGAQEARGRQTDGAVDFCEAATDLHGSVGSVVSSPDPHRDLLGIQREQSMKNSNGADRMRDGQLRAFRSATDLHGSVGSVVSSPDPHRDLLGIQREQSMKNSNGADRMRDGQLRAFAENLCTLAIRHGEHQNYDVAYALYGRALEAAQRIASPDHDQNGSTLIARIRKDRQAVYDLLCRAHGGQEKALLEKSQKVGQ